MINRVESTTKINKTKKSFFALKFPVSQNCDKGENVINTRTTSSKAILRIRQQII